MKTRAEIERAIVVFRKTVPDILCVDDPQTQEMVCSMLCMIRVLQWVIGEESSISGLIAELEEADRMEANDDSIH